MASAILDLTTLGKMLGDMAEAMGKLGDGVAHIVKLGVGGWDEASARRAHGRLKSMSAALRTTVRMNGPAIEAFRVYCEEWATLTADGTRPIDPKLQPDVDRYWAKGVGALQEALTIGLAALTELRQERNDIILTPEFNTLLTAMEDRARLVEQLATLPQPTSADDVKKLAAILKPYGKVRAAITTSTDTLNAYLLAAKKDG